MADRKTRRLWHAGLLLLAAAACLVPFADKPFHMDDPLFLWAARHIQTAPLDFFGFQVHWYRTWAPMAVITQNPPALSYYLVAVAEVAGWSEAAMHLALVPIAVGVLWGTYLLARRLGALPLPAALFTLLAPVFLVSSSNLMCDTAMVCVWVWAVLAWDVGLRGGRPGLLYLAGGLVALTALTKYFGISLLPLLGAYSLAADRRGWRTWLPPLLLAVVPLVGYDLFTHFRYGRAHLLGAMGYTGSSYGLPPEDLIIRPIRSLCFLGGCLGGLLFYAPWLWSWRRLAAVALAGGVLVALVPPEAATILFSEGNAPHTRWLTGQVVLWALVGVGVLALAASDFTQRRDPQALLLLLWVLGTLFFAGFVNWALNGRSVLPLTPAVGILLARRLRRAPPGWRRRLVYVPLAPAAALALVVTWGDARFAEMGQVAARELPARWQTPGQTCWFQGHWGFQYYIQQEGCRPWDDERHQARPGDVLIVPENNSDTWLPLSPVRWRERARYDPPGEGWVHTMNDSAGAGFYCDQWGPLPFSFGPAGPERYHILQILGPDDP